MEIKKHLWTDRKDPVEMGNWIQEGKKRAGAVSWMKCEGMESRN